MILESFTEQLLTKCNRAIVVFLQCKTIQAYNSTESLFYDKHVFTALKSLVSTETYLPT